MDLLVHLLNLTQGFAEDWERGGAGGRSGPHAYPLSVSAGSLPREIPAGPPDLLTEAAPWRAICEQKVANIRDF